MKAFFYGLCAALLMVAYGGDTPRVAFESESHTTEGCNYFKLGVGTIKPDTTIVEEGDTFVFLRDFYYYKRSLCGPVGSQHGFIQEDKLALNWVLVEVKTSELTLRPVSYDNLSREQYIHHIPDPGDEITSRPRWAHVYKDGVEFSLLISPSIDAPGEIYKLGKLSQKDKKKLVNIFQAIEAPTFDFMANRPWSWRR